MNFKVLIQYFHIMTTSDGPVRNLTKGKRNDRDFYTILAVAPWVFE